MGLFDIVSDVVGGALDVGGVLSTTVDAVTGIADQIFKQRDVIDDVVSKPLQQITQKVGAGEMWKGPNADKFVEQCQKDFLTELVHASQGFFGFGGALQKSVQAVVDADNEAASFAEGVLTDVDGVISQLMNARYH